MKQNLKKYWPHIAIGVGIIAIISGVLYYQFRQKEQVKVAFAPDSSIYSKENYTNLILDSTVLVSFYRTHLVADSIQKEVSEFYRKRAYQYAWFSENALTNASLSFNSQRQAYISDFADSSLYNAEIDTLLVEAQTQGKKFLADPQSVQKLELLLTTSFFQLYPQSLHRNGQKSVGLGMVYSPKKERLPSLTRHLGFDQRQLHPRASQ